jgi:hypothetical protein
MDRMLLSINFNLHEDDYERYTKLEAKIQEFISGYKAIQFGERVKQEKLPTQNLNQVIAEKDRQLAVYGQIVMEKDRQIREILNSYSWKLTSPLRGLKKIIIRNR